MQNDVEGKTDMLSKMYGPGSKQPTINSVEQIIVHEVRFLHNYFRKSFIIDFWHEEGEQ